MGGACSTCGRQERFIQSLGGQTLEERDHMQDLGVDGRIVLKWMVKKSEGETRTGLIWLRIGTGGGLL